MLKRTPLFAAHQKLGARLVEFGGWEMPVQYTGIMDEHQAVRTAAGIFDISHMGEVFISGPAAESFLNNVLTNDVRKLSVGQGQYTLMCNEGGGVIDDLYVYRLLPFKYLLIINASRIDEDVAWLQKQRAALPDPLKLGELDNASGRVGAVAIQGPRTVEFIDRIFPGPSRLEKFLDREVLDNTRIGPVVAKPSELKKNQVSHFDCGGAPVWVSRTGYTGEDGFEVISVAESIPAIWSKTLEMGQPFGLKPAGLGARDTLRTEVCYPLYGHELDEKTTPMEAGVGFFVALDKGDFIGRAVLAEQKGGGTAKKLVAFKMAEKSAPPRPHYAIWSADGTAQAIGTVTSGTQSPTLGAGIGLGYVPAESAKAGTAIGIEIRGKQAPAVIVPKPFYRKTQIG